MVSQHRVLDLSACRLALVLNGSAGKKDAGASEGRIRERLASRVKEFAAFPVSNGGDIAGAAKRASKDGFDIVVAFGGDGTQSAVAGALIGSNSVMGVLPGGTFNYFSRELGVGATLDEALDTILQGYARPVHIGDVNGRIFLNNACIGVYPAILERREAIYRRWGRSRIAAYWSVLLALKNMRDPMHLSLTLNGVTTEIHTPLAFAARSAFQLESLGLEGAEAVSNGQLALFLAKGHKPVHLMKAALRLAFGSVARGRDFELVVADEILIETRQSRRTLAIDGEKERVNGPFRLRVCRDALSVLVPAPVEAGPVESGPVESGPAESPPLEAADGDQPEAA